MQVLAYRRASLDPMEPIGISLDIGIVKPSVIKRAKPRITLMPASVTINAGIPS